MSISVISSEAVTGTSLTMPTHAIGDLLVFFAYRDGSTVAPTVPAAGGSVPTWVTRISNGGSSNSGIIAYVIATSASHTSGTWTNATEVGVVVLRGAGSGEIGDPPMGGAASTASSGELPTAPDLNTHAAPSTTPQVGVTGSSALLQFYGHRGVSSWGAVPSGYTRIDSVAGTDGICINSKDVTTDAESIAQPQGGSPVNSGWMAFQVEVLQKQADHSESPQYDTATVSIRTGTTDPETFTHTPLNAPQVVIVAAQNYTLSTDEVTSVTYGGVALTEVGQATDTVSEPSNTQLWFLGSGVPSGAQTVSVDFTSATTSDFQIVCVTFTADADCEVVDYDEINADVPNPGVALQAGGRVCGGVIAMVSGTAAVATALPNAEQISIDARADGLGIELVSYRAHPLSTDWSPGWQFAQDDVSLGALLFAEIAPTTFQSRVVLL